MTVYISDGTAVHCRYCDKGLDDLPKIVREYVGGAKVCPHCGKPVDYWEIVLRYIGYESPGALFSIGARIQTIRLTFPTGQISQLRLSEHKVPADAKILWVKFNGPKFLPVEIQKNVNVASRKVFPNEVALYPIPIESGETARNADVDVTVGWVPHSADDESWESLVEATESYINGQFPSMIVPANVAVESAMAHLLSSYLERFAGKDRVEDFLNAATYSHQLNVVLPVIASLKSIQLLPDHIRGELNTLRLLRNKLSHSGTLEQPLDRAASAKLLCGALFGFRYVQYVREELQRI